MGSPTDANEARPVGRAEALVARLLSAAVQTFATRLPNAKKKADKKKRTKRKINKEKKFGGGTKSIYAPYPQ